MTALEREGDTLWLCFRIITESIGYAGGSGKSYYWHVFVGVNIVLWLIASIVMGAGGGPAFGVYWFVVGFPVSLFARRYTSYFVHSHSDRFFYTKWELLKAQLAWCNGVAVAFNFILLFVLWVFLGGE